MWQVRQLQPQGVACWWQPGHSGWAIYPVDSESFVSTGTLESAQQSDQTRVTAPVPSSMGKPERLPALLLLDAMGRRLHGESACRRVAQSTLYLPCPWCTMLLLDAGSVLGAADFLMHAGTSRH